MLSNQYTRILSQTSIAARNIVMIVFHKWIYCVTFQFAHLIDESAVSKLDMTGSGAVSNKDKSRMYTIHIAGALLKFLFVNLYYR